RLLCSSALKAEGEPFRILLHHQPGLRRIKAEGRKLRERGLKLAVSLLVKGGGALLERPKTALGVLVQKGRPESVPALGVPAGPYQPEPVLDQDRDDADDPVQGCRVDLEVG